MSYKSFLLVLFLVIVPPSAHAADITTGLVGYWQLDETSGTTARDASGRGNPGTLVHNPAWASGKFGGAVSFNGTYQ